MIQSVKPLCALLLALSLAALPAGAAPTDAEQARAAFQKGSTEYNLGNFAEAGKLFEEVYRLRPVPALLFNIAQCYRFVGNLERAVQTYRSFLRNAAPADKNVPVAKELLTQVEKALSEKNHAEKAVPHGLASAASVSGGEAAQQQPAAAPAPAPEVAQAKPVPPPPAAPPPERVQPAPAPRTVAAVDKQPPASEPRAAPATQKAPLAVTSAPVPRAQEEKGGRTWTWVAAGGAGLAVAGGAFFGMKSNKTLSDLQSGYHTRAQIDADSSAAKSDAGKANLMFVGGAVLALASGAFFFLEF